VSRSTGDRRSADRDDPGRPDAAPAAPGAARRALTRLVRDDPAPADRAVVRRAEAAVHDAEAAAVFLDRVGLDRLRRAAARLDGAPERTARASLAAFERYRRVAAGNGDGDGDGGPLRD